MPDSRWGAAFGPRTPQWRARQSSIATWREMGLYAGRNAAQEVDTTISRHAATQVVFAVEQEVDVTSAGALWTQSDAVTTGLARLGFRAGDVVVSQLPNSRENTVLFLACVRMGLVVVPVVDIYGPAELTYVLRSTRARALVLPTLWRAIDFEQRVRGLGDLPDLEHVIAVGGEGFTAATAVWSELEALTGPAPDLTEVHPDSVCLVNFTSGTTSDPKGVMHSHHSLIAAARLHPSLRTASKAGPMLRMGPAGHVGAIMSLLRPFLLGDEHIYVDRFEADFVADCCDRLGARRTNAVPTLIADLLEAGHGRLPGSLDYVLLGGTSVPPTFMRVLEDAGVHAVRTWGMTEQCVTTAGMPDEPFETRGLTDGRPVPGNVVRAVDDGGAEVEPGTPGELVTMGPQMFLGYVDAGLDAAAFTPDGCYRSGDIGVVDDRGFVTIVDRKKDIVVRGGENISSREVEELLLRHPSVREAAVVAWPDERLGERVGAFVRLDTGSVLTLADVQALFQDQGVARQKTPEHLVVVEEFPRTPAGKIVKAELRKDARSRCASN
ncbi:MAG TPA: AMP-binding protein [Acidimicrobiales bacterium]